MRANLCMYPAGFYNSKFSLGTRPHKVKRKLCLSFGWEWSSHDRTGSGAYARLSHCELLTLYSYCLPWSWSEESVYKLCFCTITLYTLRPCSFPPKQVLYPSRRFFTLQVKLMCSSHVINLSIYVLLTTIFKGAEHPWWNFRGTAAPPPSPPGSYAGVVTNCVLLHVLRGDTEMLSESLPQWLVGQNIQYIFFFVHMSLPTSSYKSHSFC